MLPPITYTWEGLGQVASSIASLLVAVGMILAAGRIMLARAEKRFGEAVAAVNKKTFEGLRRAIMDAQTEHEAHVARYEADTRRNDSKFQGMQEELASLREGVAALRQGERRILQAVEQQAMIVRKFTLQHPELERERE